MKWQSDRNGEARNDLPPNRLTLLPHLPQGTGCSRDRYLHRVRCMSRPLVAIGSVVSTLRSISTSGDVPRHCAAARSRAEQPAPAHVQRRCCHRLSWHRSSPVSLSDLSSDPTPLHRRRRGPCHRLVAAATRVQQRRLAQRVAEPGGWSDLRHYTLTTRRHMIPVD